MAAANVLLTAAGLLKTSTATQLATSSSQPDPAASTDDDSLLPLTGLPMSTSNLQASASDDGFLRARFRYIVKGHSPRDGGWVRNVGYFKKVSDAQTYIRVIRPLVVLAGDYTMMRVQRIIVFKSVLAAERSRSRRRSIRLRD